MELNQSYAVVKRFMQYVTSQSRANLTRGKNNVSKSLYSSIRGEIVNEKNYFIVGFRMEQYGQFLDQGIKGANPSLVKNGKQKAPNSPYKFTTKRPPAKPLQEWAKRRNIRLRDEKGKFKKGSYKTLGFIIANRIYAQGIKPTLFFTKPYEAGFKKYIDNELVNAFGADVEKIVDYNLKDATK